MSKMFAIIILYVGYQVVTTAYIFMRHPIAVMHGIKETSSDIAHDTGGVIRKTAGLIRPGHPGRIKYAR